MGKRSEEYRRATGLVEMNAEDMVRMEVDEGSAVVLRTASGSVELAAREGDVPPGLVFVPLGWAANALVGTDTAGTGMPSFKGEWVEVDPA